MWRCKKASEFVSQSMERDMTLRERLFLRYHLLICRRCENFSKQLQVIRTACRSYLEKIDKN